jgi:enoyl-CoA hydratase/carnithine racemase
VRYERNGRVAVLTIDRPEARNAIDRATSAGLFDGLRRFSADRQARVLVLTGAGQSAFCAGADVRELLQERITVPPPDFLPQIGRNIEVTKPVIGAINGVCLGAGFMLAMNCDLLIASTTARFGIPEVGVGRGAPWAVPLPTIVPRAVAMELMVTGRPISAERAWQVGLVNEVVEPSQLLGAAQSWAEVVASRAPASVSAARRTVRLMGGLDYASAFAQSEEWYVPVYESPDAQEGVAAFLEGRPPQWTEED